MEQGSAKRINSIFDFVDALQGPSPAPVLAACARCFDPSACGGVRLLDDSTRRAAPPHRDAAAALPLPPPHSSSSRNETAARARGGRAPTPAAAESARRRRAARQWRRRRRAAARRGRPHPRRASGGAVASAACVRSVTRAPPSSRLPPPALPNLFSVPPPRNLQLLFQLLGTAPGRGHLLRRAGRVLLARKRALSGSGAAGGATSAPPHALSPHSCPLLPRSAPPSCFPFSTTSRSSCVSRPSCSATHAD